MTYTFSFLRDYMSAKGIEVVKVKPGVYTMKGNTFTLKELEKHICVFY